MSVLIADFQNRTGDPVFNGVLEQALGLGIEGASFITAYPRRDALRVAASVRPGRPLDEETARVVALSEGVGIVLVSEIAAENGGYRLSTPRPARRPEGRAGQRSDRRSRRARMACSRPSACWPARFVRRWVTRRRRRRTRAPARRSPLPAWRRRAPTPARRKRSGPGNADGAIAEFKKALDLDPEMGRAYSGLAVQYANLGRTADAEANYQAALARLDRMTDREKFRTRGSYYLFTRKTDLAVQEYTALVKAFPADAAASPTSRWPRSTSAT